MTIDMAPAATSIGQSAADMSGFTVQHVMLVAAALGVAGGVVLVVGFVRARLGLNGNMGKWEYYSGDGGKWAGRYRTNERTGMHETEYVEGRNVRRERYQLKRGRNGWEWPD